jgi:hypothetical protein
MGNLTTGQVIVSPLVQPYLNLYPNPNGPISGDTGLLSQNFKEMTNEDFGTVRADYKLTGAHTAAARYTIDDSDLTKSGGLINNQLLVNRNQYVSLEEQAIAGARGVNSLRFTFNRSNYNGSFPFNNTVPQGLPVALGFLPGQPFGGFSIGGIDPLRGLLTDGNSFVLNQFEVNDQFIYSLGRHSFKFGGGVRRYQLNGDSTVLRNGAFFFNGDPVNNISPFQQFLMGTPNFLFTTVPGTNSYRGIRESLFNVYAQDDFKATRRLTLNLGLRYEPISTPTEVNGKVSNLRNLKDTMPTVGDPFIDNPSYGNVAPRVGFALDVFGNGKTSLRGGAGIFYATILPMRYRFEISNQAPFAQLNAVFGPFPNPFSSPNTLSFPSGVIAPIAFNAEQPTIYQWNLSVQQEVARDFFLNAAYVGSRGVNLETRYSLNVRQDFQIVNGQKFFPANTQGVKFNPAFVSLNLRDFSADSYYHALQLNLTKRFSTGLQFQTAYTVSKSIDTASATESVFQNGALGSFRQDPFDSRSARALSDFDIRQNFVANFLYDLPFGKGRLIGSNLKGVTSALASGWSTGGIVTVRSGFPFNVALGFDQSLSGIDNPQYTRPNVAPGVNLSDAITGDPAGFVNPAFFQLQPLGFYGNLPRNALRGPNLRSFDMMLSKGTPINDRLRTEFRVEAFNLFNRPNFAPPNTTSSIVYTSVDQNGVGITPSGFGQLSRTVTSSRQLQFGLKLLW